MFVHAYSVFVCLYVYVLCVYVCECICCVCLCLCVKIAIQTHGVAAGFEGDGVGNLLWDPV